MLHASAICPAGGVRVPAVRRRAGLGASSARGVVEGGVGVLVHAVRRGLARKAGRQVYSSRPFRGDKRRGRNRGEADRAAWGAGGCVGACRVAVSVATAVDDGDVETTRSSEHVSSGGCRWWCSRGDGTKACCVQVAAGATELLACIAPAAGDERGSVSQAAITRDASAVVSLKAHERREGELAAFRHASVDRGTVGPRADVLITRKDRVRAVTLVAIPLPAATCTVLVLLLLLLLLPRDRSRCVRRAVGVVEQLIFLVVLKKGVAAVEVVSAAEGRSNGRVGAGPAKVCARVCRHGGGTRSPAPRRRHRGRRGNNGLRGVLKVEHRTALLPLTSVAAEGAARERRREVVK